MTDRVFLSSQRNTGMTILGERLYGVASRFVRRLRRTLRIVRDLPSRLGHAQRRSRVEAGLRGAPRLSSIVFVCHGNICRSAYAAVRLRTLLAVRGGEVVVYSAGFLGPDGKPAPHDAVAAARRRGLDLSKHRSAKFDRAIHAADAIVVMERWQAQAIRAEFGHGMPMPIVIALGDLDPEPFSHQAIRDPYGHPAAFFDDCFERIDRCVARLASMLTESNAGAADSTHAAKFAGTTE
jgi:protein-tyrosine-phosphatase